MDFMSYAYKEAEKALKRNEVPIGCVVVKNNKIIGKGYNKRNKSQMATYHAEILAINKACKKLKSWRLDNCDLYVTLMPCPMCAGAILNARIKNVYVGAKQKQIANELTEKILIENNCLNHSVNLNYLNDEKCSKIISDFFAKMR